MVAAADSDYQLSVNSLRRNRSVYYTLTMIAYCVYFDKTIVSSDIEVLHIRKQNSIEP